ncbi:DHR10 domain-containing protein [Haematococcus lacustris]|uniref:DHR10 domain-containing protein n=1 Tax=Haematococcus lacustris TaxID=44745 RepID=A0A699ZNZ5_HAELA|nr:DHR10 domain-containing protein [Haematococcus lacustris]
MTVTETALPSASSPVAQSLCWVQSPDKHRQAIAELAIAAEAKRTYCAHLSSQSIANDRKLEMVVKFDKEVCRCLKLLEELETVVVRKKDVSQQVRPTDSSSRCCSNSGSGNHYMQ